MNKYVQKEEPRKLETLYIDRSVEKSQIDKLAALKKKRNQTEVANALRVVRESAQAGKNMCEPIFQAVKAYATLQEICDEMRGVYGIYRDAGGF